MERLLPLAITLLFEHDRQQVKASVDDGGGPQSCDPLELLGRHVSCHAVGVRCQALRWTSRAPWRAWAMRR